MKFILASRSPRRRELLGKILPEFDIVVRETDEDLPDGVHPREGVGILAVRKGEAVVDEVGADALVISSDTLVELDGVPLGKPENEEDAVKMLLSLAGNIHRVHTGVAVHYKGRVYSGVDTASVVFRSFGREEAQDYVKTGEPMDKAGSYAIQGIGKKFVERYDGEFEVIVGLGLTLTERLIKAALENDEK